MYATNKTVEISNVTMQEKIKMFKIIFIQDQGEMVYRSEKHHESYKKRAARILMITLKTKHFFRVFQYFQVWILLEKRLWRRCFLLKYFRAPLPMWQVFDFMRDLRNEIHIYFAKIMNHQLITISTKYMIFVMFTP